MTSIKNIAIVGATGHVGATFVEELLKNGKHTITALTREDGTAKIPAGVEVARVNYDDEASLAAALKGQQFLIITLSVRAPEDLHSKIVKAAVKAGVSYIMPNAYGYDTSSSNLLKETYTKGTIQKLDEIKSLGGSYVLLCCGFWYEWSLAIGINWYGFDIANKKAVLMDDGKTLINTSTFAQCGRAVGKFLDLPESGGDKSVQQWKNKDLLISSFRISQRDMLDSLNRVLGTSDKDWDISYELSRKRHQEGLEEMAKGDMMGFPKAMYARMFFQEADGDMEARLMLDNDKLGLPKESLDEATKTAVEMVQSGWTPF